MKANFGILPPLQDRIRNKRDRYQAYAARAMEDLDTLLANITDTRLNVKVSQF